MELSNLSIQRLKFSRIFRKLAGFFHGFERDKMTRVILGGVDGVGRLLIVAPKKVGGDERIH